MAPDGQNPVVKVRLSPEVLKLLQDRVPPRERGRSSGVSRYIQSLIHRELGLAPPEPRVSPRRKDTKIRVEDKPVLTEAENVKIRYPEERGLDARMVWLLYEKTKHSHLFKITGTRLAMEGVSREDTDALKNLTQQWLYDLVALRDKYPFEASFWITSETKSIRDLKPTVEKPVIVLSIDDDRDEGKCVLASFYHGKQSFHYGILLPKKLVFKELGSRNPSDGDLLEHFRVKFLPMVVEWVAEYGRTNWEFEFREDDGKLTHSFYSSGMTAAWTPGTEVPMISSERWPRTYTVAFKGVPIATGPDPTLRDLGSPDVSLQTP